MSSDALTLAQDVQPSTVSPAIAANEAIARGNLQLADYLCRQALTESPHDALALSLLGHMASGLRRYWLAEDYFGRALAKHPDSAPIRAWLDRAREISTAAKAHRALMRESPPGPEKFLLIKAWGYGFWSDMDHVAGQLLLAEMTGRTPVVHWGANTLFGAEGVDNAFELYFEPVSDAGLGSFAAAGLSVYPPKWTTATLRQENVAKFAGAGSRISSLQLLGRDEDLVVNDFHGKVCDLLPWTEPDSEYHGLDYGTVYRRLFEKYIHLRPALQARVDAFVQEHIAGRHWLSVHVRGSDKIAEQRDLELVNSMYHSIIERYLSSHPGIGIFLMTDSEHFAREYRERYGDRVLATDVARSATSQGVHYGGHDGRRLGEEVVTDTYIAARCHAFLGNGSSNVSVAVRHLKDWAPGSYQLIGNDFLTLPNFMLHRW